MLEVFLSAGVPLPREEDREFYATANVDGIQEALRALVELVLPIGRITCALQPGLASMLAPCVKDSGLATNKIVIFQSAYSPFVANEEFVAFKQVRTIPSSYGEYGSLIQLRAEMLFSRQFDVGVFIGGMREVIDQARFFMQIYPGAITLPIASTGAAARVLFEEADYPVDLATDRTYPSLFKRQLGPLLQRPRKKPVAQSAGDAMLL